MTVRAISYGGGVQSTAMLVLAAQGEIDFRLALFANVGADSENPRTLDYFHAHALPYAERHGIELVELQKRKQDGTPDTLVQRIERGTTTVPIPMRMERSGAPANRTCTVDFKIKVVARELKRRGATADDPAIVALGISLDEAHRMRSDSGIPHERLVYPLIERRMDRAAAMGVISRAGLPVPPSSSCFYCPYHSKQAWRTLLRDQPELFAESVRIERLINERRVAHGKDRVWMTDAMRPLDQVITEDGQLNMFDEAEPGCSIAGYCHV